MILVESSVLMHAQRLPDSDIAKHLAALIVSREAVLTGPVIMEDLRGSRTQDEFDFLAARVIAIDYLEVDQQTWVLAGSLSRRYIRSGETMSDLDVVIAATAIRHDVPLYTLDRGFKRIPELKLYQPPAS